VWVKPPGESDGSGAATTPGNVPDAEGKRFDPSCDPKDPTKVGLGCRGLLSRLHERLGST
jgi:cellulase/cellobiase CelA1